MATTRKRSTTRTTPTAWRSASRKRASFGEDLDRLERDHVGMQLYHRLATQSALSVPTLARSRQAVRVAADGRRAFVGEQIVTLEMSPRFRAAPPRAYR